MTGLNNLEWQNIPCWKCSRLGLMGPWATQSKALLSTGDLTIKSLEVPADQDVSVIQQPQ